MNKGIEKERRRAIGDPFVISRSIANWHFITKDFIYQSEFSINMRNLPDLRLKVAGKSMLS